MELKPRKLENYIARNGKKPFREWLDRLHENVQVQIRKRLVRLGMGDFGDSKHIESGMYELRIHFGPGYRVYVGSDGDLIVILLLGGDKSTQETDIKKALKHWYEYKERKISTN